MHVIDSIFLPVHCYPHHCARYSELKVYFISIINQKSILQTFSFLGTAKSLISSWILLQAKQESYSSKLHILRSVFIYIPLLDLVGQILKLSASGVCTTKPL